MTDLRATLERTLGDTYTLEREIAAGNMSRVFVALDRALGPEIIIEPPTIISKDGRLVGVVGSPGGRTIINAVLEVILNQVDFKVGIEDAVKAARVTLALCRAV